MGRRGRPKKIQLTDDELFEELLFKAYNFYIDKRDGSLKLERNGAPLTLEETSFMIWNLDGRKTSKPLSKVMMLKTEQSALQKLRKGLAKYGINSIDDVFDPRYRTAAPMHGSTDCPE